jgi:hypothetical protein
MSDLDGRQVFRLNNSAERRNDLVQRLKVAACHPNTNGTDWLKIGDFERIAERFWVAHAHAFAPGSLVKDWAWWTR